MLQEQRSGDPSSQKLFKSSKIGRHEKENAEVDLKLLETRPVATDAAPVRLCGARIVDMAATSVVISTHPDDPALTAIASKEKNGERLKVDDDNDDLERLITEGERVPFQRDTLYRAVPSNDDRSTGAV